MGLQTEFDFVLPLGYADAQGNLHREGAMRRATALDEIEPLRDPRVERNQAYLAVILLSRVVTRLGSLTQINPHVIENLYATDLAYLQDFYNRINALEPERVNASCPECEHHFQLEVDGLGGFAATPSMLSTRR
ncbi:MAG: phage tail assembly protein [Chloroflexi bacterium]|nr:MAG: phage tail assembly protein [Chloroflexota bacterium]